MCKDKALKF